MNNSDIIYILRQEFSDILTERLDKLKRGSIVVLKRIVSYFREPLVIISLPTFLAPVLCLTLEI